MDILQKPDAPDRSRAVTAAIKRGIQAAEHDRTAAAGMVLKIHMK